MIISRATLLKDLVTKLAQMTANPPHRCYLTIDIAGEGDWKIVFGEGKEREGSGSTVDEVGMVEGNLATCFSSNVDFFSYLRVLFYGPSRKSI